MRKVSSHEWLWGYFGSRTVCGLIARLPGSDLAERTVNDLGQIDVAQRCKSCERMRGATGASKKPQELTP